MSNNPKGHPETLTPWKPGQSGNPAGRPKGSGIRYYLKKKADEVPPEGDGVRTRGEILADEIWQEALSKKKKNNLWSRGVALAHVDGNPPQQIQVEPININVTYTDDQEE